MLFYCYRGRKGSKCFSPLSFSPSLLSLSSRFFFSPPKHFLLFLVHFFLSKETKRKKRKVALFFFRSPFSFLCSRFQMQGWGALLGPEAPGDYYDGVVRDTSGARLLPLFFSIAASILRRRRRRVIACPIQFLRFRPRPSPRLCFQTKRRIRCFYSHEPVCCLREEKNRTAGSRHGGHQAKPKNDVERQNLRRRRRGFFFFPSLFFSHPETFLPLASPLLHSPPPPPPLSLLPHRPRSTLPSPRGTISSSPTSPRTS